MTPLPPRGLPSDASQFESLLPDEILITSARRPGPAAELIAAPSVRVAAAQIIREGYLLHFAQPRWYDFKEDDVALLAGDRMYSAGLSALAALRDIEAVIVVAEVIAACAEAHQIGEPERSERIWTSTLAMLARGSGGENAA